MVSIWRPFRPERDESVLSMLQNLMGIVTWIMQFKMEQY